MYLRHRIASCCLYLAPIQGIIDSVIRGVAQPGSVLAWGASGRRFKSFRPDQLQARHRAACVSNRKISNPQINFLATHLATLYQNSICGNIPFYDHVISNVCHLKKLIVQIDARTCYCKRTVI